MDGLNRIQREHARIHKIGRPIGYEPYNISRSGKLKASLISINEKPILKG